MYRRLGVWLTLLPPPLHNPYHLVRWLFLMLPTQPPLPNPCHLENWLTLLQHPIQPPLPTPPPPKFSHWCTECLFFRVPVSPVDSMQQGDSSSQPGSSLLEGAGPQQLTNSVIHSHYLYRQRHSTLHRNMLSILYYNTCSLLPKMESLAATCLACSPEVICIVESWLCISDNEVFIPVYSVVRLDRNRHGGGIILYLKENLSYRVIISGPDMLEFIFVSIDSTANRSICLGTFYRPPSSSVCIFDSLFNILGSLNPSLFSNLVLVSDSLYPVITLWLPFL